jgi:hypothetical protein
MPAFTSWFQTRLAGATLFINADSNDNLEFKLRRKLSGAVHAVNRLLKILFPGMIDIHELLRIAVDPQ